ncbi:prefoldin subunit [Candidatus Micrarchaeota archaeon]|nr:prefoldin subunit [Candidatus Micrarchaeota archaeon]
MTVEEELGAIQQQLQFIVFQRQNIEMQSEEYELTKKRLKNVKGNVLKIQGPLLIPVTKAEAEKDLNEKIENNKIKIDALKKQEEQLKNKVTELIESAKTE